MFQLLLQYAIYILINITYPLFLLYILYIIILLCKLSIFGIKKFPEEFIHFQIAIWQIGSVYRYVKGVYKYCFCPVCIFTE